MNKKILILIAFFACTVNFYGQRKPDREKIKSLKVAFFTERLDLSSSEAEAFWPVYNAHEEQLENLRKTERSEIRAKLRNFDEVSEQQAEELLQKFITLNEEKQKENKSFILKMKKMLGAKKTIVLQKTEEDFKRRLIKQYRKKKGGGRR